VFFINICFDLLKNKKMGLKASTITIKNPEAIDHETILKGLGHKTHKKTADAMFDTALYPRGNKVYIGDY
jgi:hypothetical protein